MTQATEGSTGDSGHAFKRIQPSRILDEFFLKNALLLLSLSRIRATRQLRSKELAHSEVQSHISVLLKIPRMRSTKPGAQNRSLLSLTNNQLYISS